MENNNLKVCIHCLSAIESREGYLPTIPHYIEDDDDPGICEWCEIETDILYELI